MDRADRERGHLRRRPADGARRPRLAPRFARQVAPALVALWALGAASATAATIRIACSAVGIEQRLCREGAEAWAKRTGNAVELIATPSLADQRLALFQQLLAAGSSDVDVLPVDIIWPGMLARHLVDLGPKVTEAERAAHLPKLIDAYTVDGRLVALPWFADVGLLYYRSDLLEKYRRPVPETWAALAETARVVLAGERAKGPTRLVGLVFQGKDYEGLTCNALEWIAAAGGTILRPDRVAAFAEPKAIAAIAEAASWVGGIAPRGVLNYAEEEARGVFQSGNAVFMRNWPYAWALVNGPGSPVQGKVRFAALPGGRGALGGGGLAVSRYSAHPGPAIDLVRYLTGHDEELRRALAGAFNPTRPDVYRDPRLAAARPFIAGIGPILARAVARPSRLAGARYNRVSYSFRTAVHEVLSGSASAKAALDRAARRIDRLMRRHG